MLCHQLLHDDGNSPGTFLLMHVMWRNCCQLCGMVLDWILIKGEPTIDAK